MLFRDFRTQRELDAAYDVEGSVPDFTVYARAYIEASERARRDLRHVADVRYGETLAEYADIFPAATRGAPVLIFIHGGYWRILSAREFSFVARGFATQGVTVVVANYALCPAVTIPEITRQMRALVAWCARNIDRYNGDPENITVCGHSAGGHLAAMCALTDWPGDYGLPARTIRNIVPISGLFDLEPISLTFMQPDLRISERDIAEASPQRLIARVPVNMLVTYGSDESSEFYRHSEEFRAAWEAAGNRATFFPQFGRNHFTAITDLGEPEAPLTRAILEFMEHTPRPARRPGGIDARLFPRGTGR
jgi:arylformamidase